MDFSETKLPEDETLFRAFMAWQRQPGVSDLGLYMAQMINETHRGDTEAMTVAFLANIPPEAYGVLERRFGKERMDEVRDVRKHIDTNFAYLDDASQKTREFAAIYAVITITMFDSAVAARAKTADAWRSLGVKTAPAEPAVAVPNIRMLEAAAKYQSGNAELDGLLLGKLQNMETALMKAEELGVDIPPHGGYLPFSKSELMEDGKVKRAFETMMSDPRSTEQGKALEAARMLDTFTRNPTAIATALVDIGIPSRDKGDIAFLQKRLDWDVMELLAQHNVHDSATARELAKAPLEYRQVAAAYAIVSMQDVLAEGKKKLAAIDDGNPAADLVKRITFAQMQGRADYFASTIAQPVVLERLESMELKTLVEMRLKDLKDFIAVKGPKQMLALPAPKP